MAPLLKASGLQKSYNVRVLSDFDFELRSGEVHALVGSNGAGKSTFARILSGLTTADVGAMQLNGQPYAPASKREAEHAGIIMVLQELNVIGTLTIAENIFLNRLPSRWGMVDYGELYKQTREALARIGLETFDPAMPAGQLGVGHQQLVEIAGALSQNCRVLILDEPTAALTDPEIEKLFVNIRRLQTEGVGIIYVSHRMDEIARISDRITVLRDGRCIATHQAKGVTPTQLVREMAGHDLPERNTAAKRVTDQVGFRVHELNAGSRVQDISFHAWRGEILGLAGLIGAGRTETLRAIFGADAKESGQIFVEGRNVIIRSPVDAVRNGIGLIPEDRKRDGLLLSQSIRVNTTLNTLPRNGWVDSHAEHVTTDKHCQQLAVRCSSIEQNISELSGGNQQKVVIARWLARDCQVLLFDEPTRGIDVAAKDVIYQLLRDLAAAGKTVIVVSSDLVELMSLCDRLLVMSAGRIAAEFTPENWTQEKITQAAFSGHLKAA